MVNPASLMLPINILNIVRSENLFHLELLLYSFFISMNRKRIRASVVAIKSAVTQMWLQGLIVFRTFPNFTFFAIAWL